MALSTALTRGSKPRSGIALGGIGTGSVELRADGVFYNWNIFNNTPFGTGPHFPFAEDSMLFFIVRYEEKGREPRMKILQIDSGYEVAGIPSHLYSFPWLSGVDRIDYAGTFPFARLSFADEEMPLAIEMEAFSPFVPHDVESSSLPLAAFRFNVTSTSTRPVDVMLMASMRSGVGYDVTDKLHECRISRTPKRVLFEHASRRLSRKHASRGTQALASLSGDSTWHLGWEHRHPYYEKVMESTRLLCVDDSAGRNVRDGETGRLRGMPRFFSSVARSERLRGHGSFRHEFVMAWHFPNLYAKNGNHVEGHHYANRFASAREVADHAVARLPELHERTSSFVRDFYDSSAPEFVLDQINSQLNTFHTSAWFTRKGDFGVEEGMTQAHEWGPLATVDVAMYGSISTAALFPSLDKAMFRAHRRIQFASGEVCHGIGRNFRVNDREEGVTGRIDLVPQYAIMALRGYFWTGDLAYLREMWPSVNRALEFSMSNRDPNGDGLPDHEGARCTYDNFPMYGAGSYSGSLWLAALTYAVEAARVLGARGAEKRYSALLDAARSAFEAKLWNGEYYRLYNDAGHVRTGMGADHPDLDEGCLTDQIIGQWAVDMIGAHGVVDSPRARGSLRSIVRMCSRSWGLVNCAWPGDTFLHPIHKDTWVDQMNTCWSGVELAFASLLIYEGLYREGIAVVREVDGRYRKAGLYWDHQEFGGHYFRPMSAWALVNAMLGLTIRGDEYAFAPKVPGPRIKLFFAFGGGTAHYSRTPERRGESTEIAVRTGTLRIGTLTLAVRTRKLCGLEVSVGRRRLARRAYEAELSGGRLRLGFARRISVREGQSIRVSCR